MAGKQPVVYRARVRDDDRMQLNYRESGRDADPGTAVLLLHSTATDSRMWDAQRDRLSATRRVIAPDLRGYGDSPLPPEPFVHAADVVELLDQLGLDTVALVGSSGGGHVALQLASAHPERVSHVVLLCAAADGVEPTDDVRALWARERALLEAGDLAAAAQLNADTWLGPDAGVDARTAFLTMQKHALTVQQAAGDVDESDWPVDLSRLTMPTTVVTGGHDFEFFDRVAEHLVAGIPSARLERLPWAGHLPSMERPEETSALIEAALLAPTSRL